MLRSHRLLPTVIAILMCGPILLGQTVPSPDDPPETKILVPGVTLKMIAEHPRLVTPTGIDVDDQGRIWCVAVHTHFRPEEYEGPQYDEILIFADEDGDEQFESRSLFYNKTVATMDLELGEDGWVYLSERDRVLRIKDTDGDGVADLEENIAILETTADYPHNALSGMAWHPDGDLLFSLGENYASAWKLIGADGTVVTGTGEGGIFRCSPEGKQIRRLARGFWNPFGLCIRGDGEMFAAENDPGARPPCRLLHVVEGGDYGYQRSYGPAAHHPFVRWNGGLRGTLPMIHPTGEAPCAVQPLGGGLLVPTWTDHRLDFYSLTRNGASFDAERIVLIQGGNNFRPVCISPGIQAENKMVFYVTDWVFVSYQLHERGRLWKLEIDLDQVSASGLSAPESAWLKPATIEPKNDASILADHLRHHSDTFETSKLFDLARSSDPFLSNAALTALSKRAPDWTIDDLDSFDDQDRPFAVVALSIAFDPSWRELESSQQAARTRVIRHLLNDDDPEVLFEVLRWISDDVLIEFQPAVTEISHRDDLTFSLFEACMATLNSLTGKAADGVRNVDMLLERVVDTNSSAQLRAYALRLLPEVPQAGSESGDAPVARLPKQITVSLLQEMLNVGDESLSKEVMATLAGNPHLKNAQDLLIDFALDSDRPLLLRADAIAALASVSANHRQVLLTLAQHEQRMIREEALRALRGSPPLDESERRVLEQISQQHRKSKPLVQAILNPKSLAEDRPKLDDVDGWKNRLGQIDEPGDPKTGRRIFFHSQIALCSRCHRHGGRGNVVGPDLSEVRQQGVDDSVLESILQPSLKVSPEYRARLLVLSNGKTFTGIHLRTGGGGDVETLRDSNGQERKFPRAEIEQSRELMTSLMPEGLANTLTDRELRDLLAFLKSNDQEH